MSDKLPSRVTELLQELFDSANLTNKKKIDELTRTLRASMVVADQGGVMNVESMVASQTKTPMVIFSWNKNRGELTPIQARQYALQILEASEAAVQDATLYEVITRGDKMDEKHAFALINMVRDTRRKFEGGENGTK